MTVQCILDAKGKGAAHIAPDATIAQVLQSLESQNVDALVVSCDGSSVDGIISEHDVVLGLKKFGSSVGQARARPDDRKSYNLHTR